MARRRWHFLMTPLEHGFIRGLDDRYRGWMTPQGRMILWAGTAITGIGFLPHHFE